MTPHTDPILSDDGKFWIDPLDGRIVPLVRGGDGPEGDADTGGDADSDTGNDTGSDDALAAAEEAASSPEAAAEHGFASVDDAVAELKKVRSEAASRRVALKPYEEAFQGYDDEAKAQLLEIAKGLADPNLQPATARRLKEIAERIEAAQANGRSTLPNGEDDPDQQPLTKAEWKRLQQEQEQAAAQERAIKEIEEEAKNLGFDPGTGRYAQLLFEAQDPEIAGDLNKAAEKVKKAEQAIIDAYVAEKEKDAESWPGAGQGAGTGAADIEGGAPKTWEDARKAALARLRAKAG